MRYEGIFQLGEREGRREDHWETISVHRIIVSYIVLDCGERRICRISLLHISVFFLSFIPLRCLSFNFESNPLNLQILSVCPTMVKSEARSVQTKVPHGAVLAKAGENVCINLKGVGEKDVYRGCVITTEDRQFFAAAGFNAKIVITHFPTHISPGYTPMITCGQYHIPCKISEIKCLMNKDGTEGAANPPNIKKGDLALVRFVPKRPLLIDKYMEHHMFGNFLIRDSRMLVGVGRVEGVTKHNTPSLCMANPPSKGRKLKKGARRR